MAKIFELKNPRFIKTAVSLKDYPSLHDPHGHVLPEVAIVGRSNVGKSTLINHLFRHGKLARVSSSPGKTQAINFFTINDQLAVVDLPGYGFAKVPKEMRASWGSMVQDYLEKREELGLILFLFDIRRIPNEEDELMLNWILHSRKPFILILTKVDKVSKGSREKSVKEIMGHLGFQKAPYVLYSATENLGRDYLYNQMNQILSGDVDEEQKS